MIFSKNIRNKVSIFVIIILILSSNIALAVEDLDSLKIALKNNKNVTEVLGEEGKEAFNSIGVSVFDFVKNAIVIILIIRLFVLTFNVKKATDSSEELERLKRQAIWRIAAVVFLNNFWTIYEFSTRIMSKFQI